ncbi:TetR/AcrR family transcriptional regulator [Rhodovarius crocodyli]|uniref:TetR/AcrR family transcriptional regulator n=1 Tax=Rhodovarius crocodyli TaxID=1979269 RepID=A0A437M2F1_9PROT|nr:TetR/AcrR family transcriptional regulator [Rhodovarius crocodyli]RVT91735.1 TetR/AcrR family transcriptional regulator [Rhodovarius crocodyli]
MSAPRRLPPAEREAHIVEGAIAYFSRHGMDAQMRELAAHLGISHPLLYRYFPTKEALIERVYEEFYATRWRGSWDAVLRDESLPLAERLARFYDDYLVALDDGPWLRIFAFAGLRGEEASRRYMASVRQRIVAPIAAALDRERGRAAPPGWSDELAWSLHGELCFGSIARHLYGLDRACPTGSGIREHIGHWLRGAASAPRE